MEDGVATVVAVVIGDNRLHWWWLFFVLLFNPSQNFLWWVVRVSMTQHIRSTGMVRS
ncbi:hypothetical protein Lalb_Chr20g0118611 [Lupinus albus]|uniref:Transmembrane protein n=1 Tax=Lupinus albus TaxID=3870 RepID=A0A6A4NH60_LUPAL|nr:hypothetical protein Lalb_Chr20g0118611 [Lupinus albus]